MQHGCSAGFSFFPRTLYVPYPVDDLSSSWSHCLEPQRHLQHLCVSTCNPYLAIKFYEFYFHTIKSLLDCLLLQCFLLLSLNTHLFMAYYIKSTCQTISIKYFTKQTWSCLQCLKTTFWKVLPYLCLPSLPHLIIYSLIFLKLD